MTAFRADRGLPDYVSYHSGRYQVRITRNNQTYAASFSCRKYGGRESALREAVAWCDAMLETLPPADNAPGRYRRHALRHKSSHDRVGVSRYQRGDAVRFSVNWVDEAGRDRRKTFQVPPEDEQHADQTAVAFRDEWEFCRDNGIPFDPSRYDNWRDQLLYPFQPIGERDQLLPEKS